MRRSIAAVFAFCAPTFDTCACGIDLASRVTLVWRWRARRRPCTTAATHETRAVVESMTVTIDPATVAVRFREEIRAQMQAAREQLHLVGILAGDHAPSLTYALYAQRACLELGIG